MNISFKTHIEYVKTFVLKVSTKTFSFCGTADYVPPEVLLKTGHGPSVDFWALGILVYKLVEVFCFQWQILSISSFTSQKPKAHIPTNTERNR